MANLKARLERLEENCGKTRNSPSVILISFVQNKDGQPGTLAGVELLHNNQFIERPVAESEEAFITRIETEHRQPWPSHLVLKEWRLPG